MIDPAELMAAAEERTSRSGFTLGQIVIRCTLALVWTIAVVGQSLERAIRDQGDDDDDDHHHHHHHG